MELCAVPVKYDASEDAEDKSTFDQSNIDSEVDAENAEHGIQAQAEVEFNKHRNMSVQMSDLELELHAQQTKSTDLANQVTSMEAQMSMENNAPGTPHSNKTGPKGTAQTAWTKLRHESDQEHLNTEEISKRLETSREQVSAQLATMTPFREYLDGRMIDWGDV